MEADRFEEFFREFYEKELLSVASKNQKSLNIDFKVLDKFDPELADKLLTEPDAVLKAATEALRNTGIVEDTEIVPRFYELPEQVSIRIRNLRSEHMGKFISVDGVVKRASEVKPEVIAPLVKPLESCFETPASISFGVEVICFCATPWSIDPVPLNFGTFALIPPLGVPRTS